VQTRDRSQVVVLGLAGSLVFSGLYDAVPNRWFEEEFEHLRLPHWFRPVFIVTKTAAVTGLLVGLRSPRVGRLTARALVAYFIFAVGAHVRVKDEAMRNVPALAMLVWSAVVSRAYPTD
jgi:hypothetical protein